MRELGVSIAMPTRGHPTIAFRYKHKAALEKYLNTRGITLSDFARDALLEKIKAIGIELKERKNGRDYSEIG